MKIVWQITIFLTTQTILLIGMDQEELFDNWFSASLKNIDTYSPEKKERIKKSLQNIYCSPTYNKDVAPFTLQKYIAKEEVNSIPFQPYGLLSYETEDENGTKKVEIKFKGLFDKTKERDTYISASEETPHGAKYMPLCYYRPKPGTQYSTVKTNQDGSLIAATYTNTKNRAHFIDIIARNKHLEMSKLITIKLPAKQEINNILFGEDSTHIKVRTQESVYTYDISAIVQHKELLINAYHILNSAESSPKKMLKILAQCTAIQKKWMNYYHTKKKRHTC